MSSLSQRRRRVYLDMQFENNDARILSKCDPKQIVSQLVKARANALVFWFKDGPGHAYYHTKIGLMHPQLKGRDLASEMVSECRQHDIAVIAYYIVGHDNRLATQNEQWVVKHADGSRSTPPLPCINSPYRNIVIEQLKEIVGFYDVAAVWLDMLYFPKSETNGPACHCDYCLELFYRFTGRQIPLKLEPGSKVWRIWYEFRTQTWLEFLREARQNIKAINSKVEVSENYLIFGPFDWQAGHSWCAESQCDYLSAEAYPKWFGDLHTSLLPRVLRAAGHGKSYEVIIMRYIGGWDWTLSPLPAMKAQAMTVLANGGIVAVDDHLTPVGMVQEPVYDRIGTIFTALERVEEYSEDLELVKYAALVYSEQNKNIYAAEDSNRYMLGFHGVYKALLELKVPFEVVMEEDLTSLQLRDYRVLVLPNNAIMNEETSHSIDQAYKLGLGVVATFETSLYRQDCTRRKTFALRALGAEFVGVLPTKATFLVFEPEDPIQLIDNVVTRMSFAVLAAGLKVIAKQGAVGHLVEPMLGAIDHLPDQPPGAVSIYPAAVLKTNTSRSVYFPVDLGASYAESSIPEAGQLLKNAILFAGGQPPLRSHGPLSVEATFYEQRDKNRLVVHLVNLPSGSGRSALTARLRSAPVVSEIPPVHNLQIVVSKQVQQLPSRASSLELGTLTIEDVEDCLVIGIPKLDIHDVVILYP